MCRFLHATDRPVVRLGEDFRLQALNGGVACLESYSSLAITNFQQRRLNYKVRPKWCLHLNKWIRFLLHFDFRDATTPKNLSWKTIRQECRYRKVVFSWKYPSNTKYQCAIPKSFALMPQHLSLTSTLFKYILFWGASCFHLRHAFTHLVYDLQFSDENCRVHKTLSEESMLGKLTKLASQCPGSNVLERFFQRFCLFLAFHWEHIMSSEDHPECDWDPHGQRAGGKPPSGDGNDTHQFGCRWMVFLVAI